MKKILLLMTILTFLVGVQSVQATPFQMKLFDGVTTITIADGLAGDMNPTDGVITFIGTLGVWTINVSTAITYPAQGSTSIPYLHVNSIDVSSGAGTLTISASVLGFTKTPLNEIFGVGGMTPGTVSFGEYYDVLNGYFGGVPMASLGPYGPGVFSGTTGASIVPTTPYSLTIDTVITHSGAGTTSFDAEKTVVPEPATMLLFGGGLVGIGIFARRKFHRT